MNAHAACQPGETLRPAAPAQQSAPAAEPSLAATARLAARLAGVLTVAVSTIGIAVHLGCAGWVRQQLAFHFPGVPARAAVAATVFVHNGHALVAIGGALLVAQSPYLMTPAAQGGRVHRAVHQAMRVVCEAALAAAIGANVIVIGASFGAYGMRMVRAALPHGPVELVAYSLALALYLQGRRRPLPTRHASTVAALSISALAAAALLETFVSV